MLFKTLFAINQLYINMGLQLQIETKQSMVDQ